MLLMIDNYDSFTYNLVQYFGELGQEVKVFRNDKITVQEAEVLEPEYLVISPGPCSPKEAGVSIDLINFFKDKIQILGVCLGHQAIGEAFGGKIIKAKKPMHGKISIIDHDSNFLFNIDTLSHIFAVIKPVISRSSRSMYTSLLRLYFKCFSTQR